jgi:hypothetical protein
MRIPVTPSSTRLLAQRHDAAPSDAPRRRRLLDALHELAMLRVGMLPVAEGDVRTQLARRRSSA